MPLVIARKTAQRRVSLWQTRHDSDRSARQRCHVPIRLPFESARGLPRESRARCACHLQIGPLPLASV